MLYPVLFFVKIAFYYCNLYSKIFLKYFAIQQGLLSVFYMQQPPRLDSPLLRPSGLNSSFHGGDGSFQDYIAHMQTVIALGRVDLNSANKEDIILANSPFELRPDTPSKKGILLIHGLYDCPYTLRDIASRLVQKNFLVRSVLLPGHGTVPGELTQVHYTEWLKATRFGIESFKQQQVDEIYLLGYSLGGALAIHNATEFAKDLRGLILIAPALKPRRAFVELLLVIHKFNSIFVPSQAWYQRLPQTTTVRYESYPCFAAKQACLLMRETRSLTKNKPLSLPIFMIATADDESINSNTAIEFFLQQKNPTNQLLLYSNKKNSYSDKRIAIIPSAYTTKNILDLSHTGIPIAPDNKQYGENGIFKDFQHYKYDLKKHAGQVFLGAVTANNLKKHVVQRLSYNPNFDQLMSAIELFIEKINR